MGRSCPNPFPSTRSNFEWFGFRTMVRIPNHSSSEPVLAIQKPNAFGIRVLTVVWKPKSPLHCCVWGSSPPFSSGPLSRVKERPRKYNIRGRRKWLNVPPTHYAVPTMMLCFNLSIIFFQKKIHKSALKDAMNATDNVEIQETFTAPEIQ